MKDDIEISGFLFLALSWTFYVLEMDNALNISDSKSTKSGGKLQASAPTGYPNSRSSLSCIVFGSG